MRNKFSVSKVQVQSTTVGQCPVSVVATSSVTLQAHSFIHKFTIENQTPAVRRKSLKKQLKPSFQFPKMDPNERNKLIGVIDSGTNTTRFVVS